MEESIFLRRWGRKEVKGMLLVTYGALITLRFCFLSAFMRAFLRWSPNDGELRARLPLSGHGCLVWVTFFFCTFYVPPVLLCRASIWGRWPPVLRIGLWPLFDGYFSVWAFCASYVFDVRLEFFPNFNKDAFCGKVKWNYPLCSLLAFLEFWDMGGGENFRVLFVRYICVEFFKEFVYYIWFLHTIPTLFLFQKRQFLAFSLVAHLDYAGNRHCLCPRYAQVQT